MRVYLAFVMLLLLLSSAVFAGDHYYSVSGRDENNEYMEGAVFSINGNKNVYGNLVNREGDSHSVYGYLHANCRVSGETDDGLTVHLRIHPSQCCYRY